MNLKDYQWKNRLLLLFVPDPGYEEYVQQWQTLYQREADLEDRDLLVASIFEEEVGDIDGDPIEEEDSEALRRQFRVKRDHIVAVLIGKDGTEKRRVRLPADLDALFELIDSMPMRKREQDD